MGRVDLERLEDRDLLSGVTLSVSGTSLNEIGNVSAFVASGSGGLSQPKDLVAWGPPELARVASGGATH